MLDYPEDFHKEYSSFLALQPTDERTDGQTDGRTDTLSYRDARTHLKIENTIGHYSLCSR